MNSIRIPMLLVLFIQLLFIRTYAADGFKNGEQLNVWAVDGLPLQQEAGKAGKPIVIIPYGQRVTVLGYDKTKLPVSIKTSNPERQFTLKGNWIKVSYNGKLGYVFDGYLSKMPPFIKARHYGLEEESEYLKRNYGIDRIKNVKGKDGFRQTTTYYKNGNVSIETFFDGCFAGEFYLKNITYREGILFEETSLKDGDAANEVKINQAKNGTIKISYTACD